MCCSDIFDRGSHASQSGALVEDLPPVSNQSLQLDDAMKLDKGLAQQVALLVGILKKAKWRLIVVGTPVVDALSLREYHWLA